MSNGYIMEMDTWN